METQKKNILIVDDNPFIAKVITTNLEDTFNCTTSTSAASSLAGLLSGTTKPDAIVLELNMPEVSGKKFLADIRANETTAPIPVMILSSEKSSAVRVNTLRAGANDFMVKPFNPEELLERLKILTR